MKKLILLIALASLSAQAAETCGKIKNVSLNGELTRITFEESPNYYTFFGNQVAGFALTAKTNGIELCTQATPNSQSTDTILYTKP